MRQASSDAQVPSNSRLAPAIAPKLKASTRYYLRLSICLHNDREKAARLRKLRVLDVEARANTEPGHSLSLATNQDADQESRRKLRFHECCPICQPSPTQQARVTVSIRTVAPQHQPLMRRHLPRRPTTMATTFAVRLALPTRDATQRKPRVNIE